VCNADALDHRRVANIDMIATTFDIARSFRGLESGSG